eukprot:1478207-Alexandrium_andersonii.AAC.1
MSASLVGSEMCIRDRFLPAPCPSEARSCARCPSSLAAGGGRPRRSRLRRGRRGPQRRRRAWRPRTSRARRSGRRPQRWRRA